MDANDILQAVRTLSPGDRVLLFRELFNEGLNDKERAWVSEYMVDFHPKRASLRSGISSGWNSMLNRPNVAAAVEMRMAVRDAVSELKAEYVKAYILQVLELCPLDFLEMDDEGDFVCDLEAFRKAPREMQRLVEKFEVKWIGRRKVLKLEFVSKSASLAMAAKYTLTQRIAGAIATLPWEQVAGMLAEGDPLDIVEAKLQALRVLPDAESAVNGVA